MSGGKGQRLDDQIDQGQGYVTDLRGRGAMAAYHSRGHDAEHFSAIAGVRPFRAILSVAFPIFQLENEYTA